MNILISADMEGTTGVVNWEQVTPGTSEHARFRKIMTAEVNAAIRGILSTGEHEVYVTDGHWFETNLMIEELDPHAHLNSGKTSPFGMVQGIDNHIDAAIFLGYHARAGTTHAILDHTWSNSRIANVWLNARLVGETGLNAALCGHYHVPVIMVSGDEAVCAEAMELLGSIEVAVVKKASSRMSAECLPLVSAQEKICEAAGRAVGRLSGKEKIEPFRMNTPVEVKIEFHLSDMADGAMLFPGARRLDGRRIAFTVEDMPSAYTGFRAAVELAQV
jgi:D-amino peptidase